MASFYEHPYGTVATIAHIIQCVSSIIVLGITAWAVRETKTLTVIFSLVIVRFLHSGSIGVLCPKSPLGGSNANHLWPHSKHKLHRQST